MNECKTMAGCCMNCNSTRQPIQVMGHYQCPDCWLVTETCCEGAPQPQRG